MTQYEETIAEKCAALVQSFRDLKSVEGHDAEVPENLHNALELQEMAIRAKRAGLSDVDIVRLAALV